MERRFREYSLIQLFSFISLFGLAVLPLYFANRINLYSLLIVAIVYLSFIIILTKNMKTSFYEDIHFTIFLMGYFVLQYSTGDRNLDNYDFCFFGVTIFPYIIIKDRKFFIPFALLGAFILFLKVLVNVT